ncbi:MAG: hypothetical protein U9P12_03630 [Verrucomicrobiota bacterium]|nr:hypothetical protein [Verrucomicrobiota bacterium]
MIQAPTRGILWAALLAAALHALLFLAVRPTNGEGLGGVRVAPETRYLAMATGKLPMAGTGIRTTKSPVVFSLPSGMGFSHELLVQDVATPLNTFSRPVPAENFLEIDHPVAHEAGLSLFPLDLMLTAGEASAPALPVDVFQPLEKRPAARRVTLAPELKDRMVGGVVLPPLLNQEAPNAWEVRASVSVSEMGSVRHVFLDQPLDSEPLNQQVLQLLYSLRFKPGESIEGGIEIYSPGGQVNGGAGK